MKEIVGIIGGTGIYSQTFFEDFSKSQIYTEYGEVEVFEGEINSSTVIFLSRHGESHSIPPHKINYRANLAALKKAGASSVLATNAVGGIADNTGPGKFIVPDQIIDYTWGREQTYFDSFTEELKHIDFSFPFDSNLRLKLIGCLNELGEVFAENGCYGCTQGPRLESSAEIKRLQQDGCTIVGMTGMPEAALARELDLPYASLCFSVNWAAGLDGDITIDQIKKQISSSVRKIQALLNVFFT